MKYIAQNPAALEHRSHLKSQSSIYLAKIHTYHCMTHICSAQAQRDLSSCGQCPGTVQADRFGMVDSFTPPGLCNKLSSIEAGKGTCIALDIPAPGLRPIWLAFAGCQPLSGWLPTPEADSCCCP